VVDRGAEAPGAGVAPQAMTSVEGVQESTKVDHDAALKRYEDEAVGYNDIIATNGVTNIELRPRFFAGKFKRPLVGADFYDAVGRKDLADRYDARNTGRWTLIIGGSAIVLGGTIYFFAGVGDDEDCTLDDDFSACLDRNSASVETHAKWFVGATVVGSVVSIIGFWIDPHPVDAPTQRRLAGEHNDTLKKDLGISDSARAEKPSVSLRPYMLESGGGLVLAGTF